MADDLGIRLTPVKAFLRGNGFAGAGRYFSGADCSLTREEEHALRDAGTKGVLAFDAARRKPRATPEEPIAEPTVLDADVRDLPPPSGMRKALPPRSDGGHPVYLHQEVLEALEDPCTPKTIKKAVTRRLQELMAHGRATRVKGVRGQNKGWLRIPLGGNSGFHDYLWLLNHGEKVARQDARELYESFPAGARLIRAVRHHDETSTLLPVGFAADYVRLSPLEAQAQESTLLVDPLVEAQRALVADPARVRLIQGQPGAGKTTALLASAMTLEGRVLYLTWSASLAELAREWLAAHGPEKQHLTVWTFDQFLSAIDPRDARSQDRTVAEGARLLRSELGIHARELGPWWHDGELRAEELFAELRAHYVGAALPVTFRGRASCRTARLSDTDYGSLRRDLGGAVQGVLAAARALSDDDLRRLFPQPVAAFQRADALQRGDLELDTKDFAFESMLVDEVQDLTLAEQWLLLDVAARSGVAAGVQPSVVIAGDESQTVRATAFQWAELSDLVHGRLGVASREREDHLLSANLRSPSEVANVIGRARKNYYSRLPKGMRPRGRDDAPPEDAIVGRVVQVSTPDEATRDALLRAFEDANADAALIYPGPVVPADLVRRARELGTTIWSADLAKGLEFRVVAVMAMDVALKAIDGLLATAHHEPLASEFARSEIDRLVVSLSRTTETLVLVADQWGEEEKALMAPLLDRTATEKADDGDTSEMEISCEDVIEIVQADAADVRERIEALVLQSQHLSERGSTLDALAIAKRAVALLGRSGRPGAAGLELRRRARRQLGRCLATDGLTGNSQKPLKDATAQFRLADEKVTANTLKHASAALFGDPGKLETNKALRSLAGELVALGESEGALVPPVVLALRSRVESLVETRVVPDTRPRRAALLEAVATLAAGAPRDRDAFGQALDEMTMNMLRHLASSRSSKTEYEQLRHRVGEHADVRALDAQHAECLGDFGDAADQWEALGRPADAIRCLRLAGDLGRASKVAASCGSPDAPLLEWETELLDLLGRRPPGVFKDAERKRLQREFGASMRSTKSMSSTSTGDET